MRPPTKGINVNKEKLVAIKNKIKDHAPEIIFAAFLSAVATTHVIYLKKQATNNARFPKGERTILWLHDEDWKKMTDEDLHPYFEIEGHEIKVQRCPEN